jgi:hypothetical protein
MSLLTHDMKSSLPSSPSAALSKTTDPVYSDPNLLTSTDTHVATAVCYRHIRLSHEEEQLASLDALVLARILFVLDISSHNLWWEEVDGEKSSW